MYYREFPTFNPYPYSVSYPSNDPNCMREHLRQENSFFTCSNRCYGGILDDIQPYYPVSPYSHPYSHRQWGMAHTSYIRNMRAFRNIDHLRNNIARLLGRMGYVLIRIGVDEFNNLGVTGQIPGTAYQEGCVVWIYHKHTEGTSYEETVLAQCDSDEQARRIVNQVVLELQRMNRPLTP